jgi:predicted Zn-dependent protease
LIKTEVNSKTVEESKQESTHRKEGTMASDQQPDAAMVSEAMEAFVDEDYATALQLYTALIATTPQHTASWVHRSATHLKLDQPLDALAAGLALPGGVRLIARTLVAWTIPAVTVLGYTDHTG